MELAGDEVRLRPIASGDADLIVRWRSRTEVATQLFSAPPTGEEHVRWAKEAFKRGDREEYVICWHQQGDRPVGTIGLSAISSRHRRAEYGILVGEPDARGHGLARAASELMLRRAFRSLGLDRVYLHAFADNAPAIALYQRLGFVREGVLRAHARRDGDVAAHDVVVMGLLRQEWAVRDGQSR